jgi:hypothetical protein
MVGLIWFVQLVHYPGFAQVGTDAFVSYTREHVRRTGWVVGPPMLAEAACAVLIIILAPASSLAWLGLALLIIIWLTTALVQVPVHRRLNETFDQTLVERLVRSNWIRTLAWSARGVVALLLLAR